MREGVSTGVVTFVLAILVSAPMRGALSHFPAILAAPLTLLIVIVGVAFDTIGLAAASTDEAGFHAMAAKRIPGARHSILVVRNAGRVITVCNDIIGDLAGTLGGAMAASAVFELSARGLLDQSVAGTVAVALVAGLTVGGKAAAKRFAIERAAEVTRFTGYVLYLWERSTGMRVFRDSRSGGASSRRRK